MARKHKKRRTHVDDAALEKTGGEKVPKSFVIRRGKVPALVRELIKDTRKMMSPFTALKLRERKTNNLKDYVSLSGTLGVSHMLCFSTTEAGTYLRLGKLPRGPTLYFKVENYTLCKDVAAAQRRPHSPGTEFLSAPIVVLNNMQSEERHIRLTDIMVQNLFPAIDVDSVKLSQCRRVVLFRRDPDTGSFDLRHYVVNVKAAGLTRGIKKIVRRRKIPNLSRYDDIGEYVTGGGASDSEGEDGEDERVQIEAGQKAIDGSRGARHNKEAEEAAVKLTEIGPRLNLTLMKVEDGFCTGEVLYHHHLSKSPEEMAQLREELETRNREKAQRKAEQAANIERKKEAEAAKRARTSTGAVGGGGEDSDDEAHPLDLVRETAWSSDDDADHYRQEVGQEPEAGTFSRKNSSVRRKPRLRENGTVVDERADAKKVRDTGKAGHEAMLKEQARRKALKVKKEKMKTKKRQRSKKK